MPVRTFGGCYGKFGGRRQSERDFDDEDSAASGGGSNCVGDFSSSITETIHVAVPTATVTGTWLPRIVENHCAHRAFYYIMYSARTETHEPPHGRFGDLTFDI